MMLETVTKKQFRQLHASKSVLRVQTIWNDTKENIINVVCKCSEKISGIPVTSIDLNNDGDYVKISIFTFHHNNQTFYILELITDYSKCRTCNMDNVQIDYVLYVAI